MELAGFCLFLFLMLYGFGKGFSETSGGGVLKSPPWPYEIEDATFEQIEDVEEKEKIGDWDAICRKAMEQARDGNSSARAWVTKHIYEADKKEETTTATPKEIIDEGIMALRSLGLNKVEAERKAADLGSRKCYDSVEELINDAFKKEG